MDNLAVCKHCRRMFNSIFGKNVCPSCQDKLEDDLQKVKTYLWDNKGASIPQVAEACDVSASDIRTWLREERISLCEGAITDMVCEKCGRMVYSGRLCPACKDTLQREMTETLRAANREKAVQNAPKQDYRTSAKMRFVNGANKNQ